MQIRIREMKKKDVLELSRIYAKVYSDFDVGEKWTPAKARKLLVYWLKRQPDLAFVAEAKRKPVGGFVAGVKPWWDGNHLVDGEIFVRTDFQKKGVGSALSKKMFEKAIKKYDVKVWDTYTFKGKYPLKWYKSLGFSEVKEWVMISGSVKTAARKLGKS